MKDNQASMQAAVCDFRAMIRLGNKKELQERLAWAVDNDLPHAGIAHALNTDPDIAMTYCRRFCISLNSKEAKSDS